MKICVIANDFSFDPLGGRNIALRRIMEGVTSLNPDMEFHVITRSAGMKYERKGNIFSYRLENFKRNARDMVISLDEKVGFDVIHGFDMYPDGYIAVSAAAAIGKPCIAGIRETYILNIGKLVLGYIAKNADFVVSVDRKSMESFKRITGRSDGVLCISNSIRPPGRKEAKKSGEFVIGNVAYLGDKRKAKCWNHLLEEFGKIREEAPESMLVLVGSSDTRKDSGIIKLVRMMGLEDCVTVKGIMKHEDVIETMRGFDIYVSPSAFEGMPNTVLEAMALGKPVVATGSGGVPEIIKDGYNGMLVRELSPGGIHDRVISLHRDADLRKRLGANAYRTITRKFNPKKESMSWYALYKTLCKESR